jgi:hypothetical protein
VNRRERRAAKAGDTFWCQCRHCGGRRSITVAIRNGEKDLMAENDCKCEPKPADLVCDQCGIRGKHWLGCDFIGLPESPAEMRS